MFIFMFNMTMELVYMGIYRRNINVTISDIDKYKAVYCELAYLTYMQNASCEMPGWMKHKLESRHQEKHQHPQIYIWYNPTGRKQRGTKEPLDERERGE